MPRMLMFDLRDQSSSSSTTKQGDRKIRCPKCKWQPGKHDRWACACGHVWNTFDTRGMCPACDAVWKNTQCLKCHDWSPHDDWYATDDGASP